MSSSHALVQCTYETDIAWHSDSLLERLLDSSQAMSRISANNCVRSHFQGL